MKKLLCAAFVVGILLLVGSGVALATLISVDEEVSDLWNPDDITMDKAKDGGTQNVYHIHSVLLAPFTSPPDSLTSAYLYIYLNGDIGFKIGLALPPDTAVAGGSAELQNGSYKFSADVSSYLDSSTGNLSVSYDLAYQNGKFIFEKSELVANWRYWVDDGNGDTGGIITSNAIAPIPEPATMLLLGTGLVGVAGAVRRKMKLA